MTISAQLQITPAADRRGWTRRSLSLVSSLQSTGSDVTIHDVSATGLLIETTAELAVFDDLEIELPEAGFTPALVVWSSGKFYGCQFKQRISQAAISASLLRSPPSSNCDTAFQLRLPESVQEARLFEDVQPEESAQDYKASLSVRLRVIFGGAILLWALIIWAAWSLYKFI
jgi:hypothetical protein